MCIRCHGGRMRYAPTPVRLWIDAVGLISDVFSLVSWFEFWWITVGAYRIRPHVREYDVFRRWMETNFVEWEHIRCHGGRMRYAPTHVRLWWYVVGLILDVLSWVSWFEINRKTVGAYRIRPHVGELGVICRWMETNFVEWEHIRRRGGRMRYAPTLVRLWGYAVGLILDMFSWVLWFEFWLIRCYLSLNGN